MTKVANIAKNTSYFTIALVLQKAITFIYFTMLARNFAPDDLGKYYFALSFTTIFSIFIDLGLANVLIREVAKINNNRHSEPQAKNPEAIARYAGSFGRYDRSQDDKNKIFGAQVENLETFPFANENRMINTTPQNLLSSVLAIKIPLAIMTVVATIILINVLNYPAITRQLVYLSTVCMLLDSFTLIFFSIIRAFHNLKYESIASVIYQLIALSFGLLILKLKMGLFWQMNALVLASIFNIVYAAGLIKYKWKLSLKPSYNPVLIKYLVKITLAFGIYGVLQRLWTYFDTVLLSILAGDYYVGIYQVAFKIINALQFLPMAFVASLYPALSSYWHNNRPQLAVTFERSMNYLIIISLPISIGIAALADKIVLLFKAGYAGATLPLQINIIALIFLFLNFPIGSLLNACDRQKRNTANIAVALIVSIILNIILIPKWHAVGASITVLATSILMFILGITQVPKITAYNYRKILVVFAKTLLSAVIMGLSAIYLKNYLNIFIVVAVSGLIYFAVLFALKGFKKEDILSIWRSFRKT